MTHEIGTEQPGPGDGPTLGRGETLLCSEPARGQIERYLSADYEMSCAGCHGSFGEGHTEKGVPALPGSAQSFDAFRASVRAGRPMRVDMYMPAFAAHVVSDEVLKADWEKLSSTTVKQRRALATLQEGPEFRPAVDDVEGALAEGLTLFRKAGSRGACQGCHGTGADLARINFRDSDILRRCVGQEMAPEECSKLVTFVHALRARLDMQDFCDRKAPFLQPGGELLPGATPEERDLALADELLTHGIDLHTRLIRSTEEADALLDRFRKLDFHAIRVAYPMNQYTQDAFHGAQHLSTAEWIPDYPHTPLPGQEDKWNARFDRYLADPSGENLWALMDDLELKTHQAPAYVDERESRDCENVYLWEQQRLGCEVSDCACDDESCEPIPEPGFKPGIYCSPVLRKDNGEVFGVSNGTYKFNDGKWEQGWWSSNGVTTFSHLKYRSVLMAGHFLIHNRLQVPTLVSKAEGERALKDKDFRRILERRGPSAIWSVGQRATAGGAPHGINVSTGAASFVPDTRPFGGDNDPGSINYDVRRHLPWMELAAMIAGGPQTIPEAMGSIEYYKTNFPKSPRHTDYGDQLPLHHFYRIAVLIQLAHAERADPGYVIEPHEPGDWSRLPDGLQRRFPNDDTLSFEGAKMKGEDDPRKPILEAFYNNFFRLALLRETTWIERTGQCDVGNSTETWLRPYFLTRLEEWLIGHSPKQDAAWLHATISHLSDLSRTCNRGNGSFEALEQEIIADCRKAQESNHHVSNSMQQGECAYYGVEVTLKGS